MGERFIRIVEHAESFDAALALAVQITEREGFKAPNLMVQPEWEIEMTDEGEQGRKLSFCVSVSSSYDTATGKEHATDWDDDWEVDR